MKVGGRDGCARWWRAAFASLIGLCATVALAAPPAFAAELPTSSELDPATVLPPVTVPPVTVPPVTDPTAAVPSVTVPPVTTPPVTTPPVTTPPVTAPPVTAPRVTAPPVTAPPVTAPRVTAPPVTQHGAPLTGVTMPAPPMNAESSMSWPAPSASADHSGDADAPGGGAPPRPDGRPVPGVDESVESDEQLPSLPLRLQRAAAQTARHLSFPMVLAVAIAVFLIVQHRMDRADPRVTPGGGAGGDDLVGFS